MILLAEWNVAPGNQEAVDRAAGRDLGGLGKEISRTADVHDVTGWPPGFSDQGGGYTEPWVTGCVEPSSEGESGGERAGGADSELRRGHGGVAHPAHPRGRCTCGSGAPGGSWSPCRPGGGLCNCGGCESPKERVWAGKRRGRGRVPVIFCEGS